MKALSFIFFITCLLLSSSIIIAQPANDNCSNATALTVNVESCSTLDGATTQEPTETYDLTCANSAQDKSVWYSFTATNANMSFNLYKNESGTVTDSKWAVAIYHTSTAGCYPAGTSSLGCTTASSVNGNDDVMVLNLTGLTTNSPNNKYLIQITYKPGNSNAPDFCLTVGATVSCGTCAAPCGAACVYASYTPTTAQVLSSCTGYLQTPMIEGGETATECYTFTADKSIMSCGLLTSNPLNSPCGSVTYNYNWTLYNSSCSQMSTGTKSSTTLNGLTIGQSYRICYAVTPVGGGSACFATKLYPYVYPNFILPIQLTTFTGNQTDDNITLNWSTASEENNDYFVVQRSTDGENFTDLGKVAGHGTSTVAHSYSYIDRTEPKGMNYYRLQQTDFPSTADSVSAQEVNNTSGETKVTYSEVIAVEYLPETLFTFTLAPESANISLFNSGQSYVIVFDERGVIVYSTVVDGPGNIQVPIQNKNGIWFACLVNGNHKELMRAF